MSVHAEMNSGEHEMVIFCNDQISGLKAIIAIHDTTLGPALGGTRLWPYANEDEALFDVLRLSKGMTYKNAAAGLDLGGGKAVIIADPKSKSKEQYQAFGRYVEALKGLYVTSVDMNTNANDLDEIRKETEYVVGGDDNSRVTAIGVYEGIKVSVLKKLGMDSLAGITVAIQGVGHVGRTLCSLLYEDKVNIIACDVNQKHVDEVVQRFGVTAVATEEIYTVDADIFSPCATGGILNDDTIPKLKSSIVAGAANNQLLNEFRHDHMLHERGILYAPDFIINAGGVIKCYCELNGDSSLEKVEAEIRSIYQKLEEIYQLAEERKLPTQEAAITYARNRIDKNAGGHPHMLIRKKH